MGWVISFKDRLLYPRERVPVQNNVGEFNKGAKTVSYVCLIVRVRVHVCIVKGNNMRI